jgi:membrane-bound lytic murein transglycosylase D
VPLIHAAIVVAKSPEKYGFEVTPEPALEFETIPVNGAIDLRLVAECAEAEVGLVQTLNPQLRRLATPADRTFSLRVPAGRGVDTQKCLDLVPPEKRVRFRTHVVTRGQTLASIAQKYGAPARDIAQANGLSPKKRLPVATELIIPIDPRAKAVTGRRTATADTPGPKAPDLPAAPGAAQRLTHRIRPGDTLGSIASRYGTTVQDLQTWNGLRTSRIAAGSTLTIYTHR